MVAALHRPSRGTVVGSLAGGGTCQLSFRNRLRLFFGLIVIVPMVALGFGLFALTARSETGKADAGIVAGGRAAVGLYREEVVRARPALRRIARDRALRLAIASRRPADAERRMRRLASGRVRAVELWSSAGERLTQAGSRAAVAAAGLHLVVRGRSRGFLSVSVTDASSFAYRVNGLTGREIVMVRGGRPLASTLAGRPSAKGLPQDDRVTTVTIDGEKYRSRFVPVTASPGPTVRLGVLSPSATVSEQIAANRLLIACLLTLFVLLALISAGFVGRGLAGQIETFLAAARRLSRGDFRHPVPVHGKDEFAALGREFNDMSEQLEAKIEEVERKRQELAETIRRVGDALATGLDRRGVVALAVRQAVDACEAEVGRSLPLARGAFAGCEVGTPDGALESAIEAAERDVFMVSPDVGPELIGALEGDERAERTRRAVSAHGPGVHALSIGLRSLVDGPEYLGAISIARHGKPFTRDEEELLEYLAGQAVVSIENASLHEAVERQAVTDELTGLANVRAFLDTLDRELERSRRFGTPLGLVMVDLDDFKRVNDTYGHQQGDEVLAQVACVLRESSRELDTAARYGGEELAMILPQTDASGAELLAERVREAIESLPVRRVDGKGALRVTASFGVAAAPESGSDRMDLIAAADAALYTAKRGGKNRVERAEMAMTEPFTPHR
jgi:diguanylate cyclase (GGDEF)-like protein